MSTAFGNGNKCDFLKNEILQMSTVVCYLNTFFNHINLFCDDNLLFCDFLFQRRKVHQIFRQRGKVLGHLRKVLGQRGQVLGHPGKVFRQRRFFLPNFVSAQIYILVSTDFNFMSAQIFGFDQGYLALGAPLKIQCFPLFWYAPSAI